MVCINLPTLDRLMWHGFYATEQETNEQLYEFS